MFLLISCFCIVLNNGSIETTIGGGSYDQILGKLIQPVGNYGWCAVGYNESSSMMTGAHVNVYNTNDGSFISSHTLGYHNGGTVNPNKLSMITNVVKNGNELHFDISLEKPEGNILYACGSGSSLSYHSMKGAVKAYETCSPAPDCGPEDILVGGDVNGCGGKCVRDGPSTSCTLQCEDGKVPNVENCECEDGPSTSCTSQCEDGKVPNVENCECEGEDGPSTSCTLQCEDGKVQNVENCECEGEDGPSTKCALQCEDGKVPNWENCECEGEDGPSTSCTLQCEDGKVPNVENCECEDSNNAVSNPNAQNENVNQTSSNGNNDDINVVSEKGQVVTSYSSKCMLHPALIFMYFM